MAKEFVFNTELVWAFDGEKKFFIVIFTITKE